MFFELVSILFAIVPDYGNDYLTKENNNWTSFKNFAPKLNLNHNINITEINKFIVTQDIASCRTKRTTNSVFHKWTLLTKYIPRKKISRR